MHVCNPLETYATHDNPLGEISRFRMIMQSFYLYSLYIEDVFLTNCRSFDTISLKSYEY